MKRHFLLSIFLCLVFCLALSNSAFGETQTSAKQLFLTDLKKDGIVVTGLPFKLSSGTSVIELKKFESNEPGSEIVKRLLTGAALKFDTKIDNPAEKLAAKYTLTLGQQDCNGSIYMDSDKLILSTEFMDFFKNLYVAAPIDSTLPRYVYFTDMADTGIWDSLGQTELSPAWQEMLVFIFEAVPEQYYKLSHFDDKVILHIDRNGLPEVIRALMLKALAEQERFAGLGADIMTSFDPAVSKEEAGQDILEALQDLQELMDTPDSPDKMLEMMGEELAFDLVMESSLLPAGQDKCLLRFGIDDPEFSTNINIESAAQGSKKNLKGTASVSLSVSDKAGDFGAGVKMKQDFNLTTAQYRTNSIIDFNFSEISDEEKYLRLSLKITDHYKPEKSITISIPELTPANSKNLSIPEEGYIPAPPHEGMQVVLDGEVISFDADPFIKEGRTVVPLRSLAEKLGFTVTWSEPNQIILNNEDTTITMFLGEQVYTVNGIQKHMDISPFETGGRTMVPVRFMAEESGCMVFYSEAKNTVFINHKTNARVIPSHTN